MYTQSPKASWGGVSWRQCSIYSLNLQLGSGGGSNHPCPLLDCLKRWQSHHTCHHHNRFNELATKNEKWNGKPRLACVNVWHQTWKLLWMYCPGHAGMKGNDWAGKSTITSGLCLRRLKWWEELETLPVHTKPGVDRCGKKNVLSNLPSSIKWTLELFQWQCRGNFMGYSKHIDTSLNWTVKDIPKSTPSEWNKWFLLYGTVHS